MFELRIYSDRNGNTPFTDWLNRLKDVRVRATIRAKLVQLESGNLGDFKSLRNGVQELRIHYGPGYRVYLSRQGPIMLLLLCGSCKNDQQRAIKEAISHLNDWKSREP